MLHICRHYKPDIVYLYFSGEMIQHEEEDSRNRISLRKLGEKLNHSFDIRVIRRENLTSAQQYDYYYKDFKEEIEKIEADMDSEDELFLNMASGTPAMKSALLILATLCEYRYKPIQVSSPLGKSNIEHDDRDGESWEEIWECNEDNDESAPNRCEEIKCLNLMYLMKLDTIKKFVKKYDYDAALSVADEIRDDMDVEAYSLIKGAKERIMLSQKTLREWERRNGISIFPGNLGDRLEVLEYALYVQVKVKKAEYSDYARAITPLIVRLLGRLAGVVTNKKYNFNDLINRNDVIKQTKSKTIYRDGAVRWDMDALEKSGLKSVLDNEYINDRNETFRGGVVYSDAIARLIKCDCNDDKLISVINDVTEVERRIRNVAAHEIRSITNAWFLDKVGKTAEKTFTDIKYLAQRAKVINDNSDWDLYDKMNDIIVNKI